MKYWIICLEWTQSDQEFAVVQAASREDALARFIYANGPRYVSCYGSVDKIL